MAPKEIDLQELVVAEWGNSCRKFNPDLETLECYILEPEGDGYVCNCTTCGARPSAYIRIEQGEIKITTKKPRQCITTPWWGKIASLFS